MSIYITLFAAIMFLIGLYALITGTANIIHFRNIERKAKPLEDGEKVSVVIPARNEEANLPLLLESMTKQTYKNFEVIVIDDASTDRTGEIIAEFEKKDPRIHGYRTTPGRRCAKNGKINALIQAIEHVTGDYIYCTDADTIHNPGAIAFGYSVMKDRNLDIISGFPEERCRSFIGMISMSSMLLSFIFVPHFLARYLNSPLFTVAIGQFVMMKKSSYDEIGGYASVGTETCDDMAIAKQFVRNGKKYHFVPISQHVICNMYTARKDAFYGIARSISGLVSTKWYVLILVAFVLVGLAHIILAPVFTFIFPLWRLYPIQMIFLTVGWFFTHFVWFLSAQECSFPLRVSWSCGAAIWQIGHMYLYGLRLKLRGKKFIWKGRPID